MIGLPRFVLLACVAMACSACAPGQFSRNVYEGARVHNESLKSTPLENTKAEPVGYDQYEKERQGGAADRSK